MCGHRILRVDIESRHRSIDRMEGASKEKLEQLARMDRSALETPGGMLRLFGTQGANLIPFIMTGVPGGNAVQSSPDPITNDPCLYSKKAKIVHHAFSKPPVAEQIRIIRCSVLVCRRRCRPTCRDATRPMVRLAVVHEKYWLAILHKSKLMEFRSSKHPQCSIPATVFFSLSL